MAPPAPTGDPWGYMWNEEELDKQELLQTLMCLLQRNSCNLTQSSTEAMDTDEGQQTSARLLEEAQHLPQVRAEPTYTTIEEPTTTMTGGSEAIISDILSMQDTRELTLSEVGERRIAPLEMKGGLPAGSFSPFDYDKEFQARHGVRPEDANRP